MALPQILAHREPHRMLGISTARYKQLRCPIDLVYSCRENDILLLQQIKQYCLEGQRDHPKFRGLRNFTLLLTKENQDQNGRVPPFQEQFQTKDATFDYKNLQEDFPNAETIKSRLSKHIVADAIRRLIEPYRVIVSGPDAYNKSAREFLTECEVASARVTMLSA